MLNDRGTEKVKCERVMNGRIARIIETLLNRKGMNLLCANVTRKSADSDSDAWNMWKYMGVTMEKPSEIVYERSGFVRVLGTLCPGIDPRPDGEMPQQGVTCIDHRISPTEGSGPKETLLFIPSFPWCSCAPNPIWEYSRDTLQRCSYASSPIYHYHRPSSDRMSGRK